MASREYTRDLKLLSERIGEKNVPGKEKIYAAIIGNMRILYADQGNYALALKYYYKALKINEKLKNRHGEAVNLGNIGIVYWKQDNYVKAWNIISMH